MKSTITCLLHNARKYLSFFYFLCLLTVFPLLERNGYYDILVVKASYFYISTTIFLSLFLIILVFTRLKAKRKSDFLSAGKNYMPILCLIGSLFISFLLSPDRYPSFWGTNSRFTGFFVLLLSCILFIIYSQNAVMPIYLLLFPFLATCFIEILAWFNHLGYNPFLLCSTYLDSGSQFISTMGQRNCFAAYTSMILSLSLPLSVFGPHKFKIPLSFLSFLCFLGILSASSDSGFLAAGILFLLTLWFSMLSPSAFRRWAFLLLLFGCANTMNTLFVNLRYYIAWDPEGISALLYTHDELSIFLFIVLPLLLIGPCGFLMSRCTQKKLLSIRNAFFIIISLVFLLIIVLCMILPFNYTYKEAKSVFGRLTKYIYFREEWGTNRGLIWTCAIRTFNGMPFFRKLIGIGPGMFRTAAEHYDLSMLYNNLDGYLLDAHSEYLQYLITTGIVGLSSYLSFFIWILCRFYKCKSAEPLFSICGIAFTTAFLVQAIINNIHIFIEPVAFTILGCLYGLTNGKKRNTDFLSNRSVLILKLKGN